jgi:sigma-B regulation protein RsbU (phosphoserine phosphatase)
MVPGVDLDARYLAAQKVSGDLYDVFELGYGRLGLAVADVSGKGVSASLLMASCRTALRQIAPAHFSPAKVLTELNRALAGDMREGTYITMVYAVVDATRNSLIFARAGHERPLVSRRSASAGGFVSEFVASEGMPLGLVEPALFESVIEDKAAEFLPGATLLLYTDGLTEAPNAEDKEFGGARLADALRSAHAGSARQINDAILQSVQNFTGAAGLRDDYTLLTVKRV